MKLLSVVSDEVPDWIRGDSGRLRQVLLNLVDNAVKFTEAGQVSVHVEVRESGKLIKFAVKDTGTGIPEQQHTEIFRPFAQADNSMTRRFGGLGLGLTICRELVELMGGNIGIEAREGSGSTFWFHFPLEPSAHARGAADHDRPSPVASKRVLVAEDSATHAHILCLQLRRLGYETEVARNGRDCVDALRQRQYCAILMDWHLPELGGIEATRRIRALDVPYAKGIPIIAVAAHALPQDREACLAAGMNDYIAKPVDVKLLNQVLCRWCTTTDSFSHGATDHD